MLLPRFAAVRVALSITLSALPITLSALTFVPLACLASPEEQTGQPRPQSLRIERASSPSSKEKSLLHQASALYHQGDRGTAERLFKQVLTLDPGNADANFSLGAIAEQRGELAAALCYYQAALAANPSDKEAIEAVESLQAKMHWQNMAPAEKPGSEGSTKLAGHVDTLAVGADTDLQRGLVARDAGRTDEALAFLQKALQQNPHELQAMIAMAEIYSRSGQHVPALACYQMALREQSSNPRLKAAVELESNKSGLPGSAQQPSADPGRTHFTANLPVQQKARRSTGRTLVNICGGVLQVAACVGICNPSRHLYQLWNPRF
jgi:tetratricopeptide (TPR) repeat protein